MICWKCFGKIEGKEGKVGFRAECPHCAAELHTCVGCRFYSPGKPNDCSVPGTDWIKDRDRMNFCEEFSPNTGIQPKKEDEAKQRARKLFGFED